MKNHEFKPIPLYVVGKPDPLWTDWCSYIEDDYENVCFKLVNDPIHNTWRGARMNWINKWLMKRRIVKDCRIKYNHCWHAIGFVDFECCLCPGETDGQPPNNCTLCASGEHRNNHHHLYRIRRGELSR